MFVNELPKTEETQDLFPKSRTGNIRMVEHTPPKEGIQNENCLILSDKNYNSPKLYM